MDDLGRLSRLYGVLGHIHPDSPCGGGGGSSAFLASAHVEQEQALATWEDDLTAREVLLREEEQCRQPPGDGTATT